MKEYFLTDAKYLILEVDFPYQEMLQEAKALKDLFVEHRYADNFHKGWKGLTLHGLGGDKTGSWEDYGYKTGGDAGADMFWTSAAQQCPVTMDFFLNKFPCKKYGRVRFMLLEAGGYIGWHTDSSVPMTENINIALNNPGGCKWHWKDGSPDLIMEAGKMYAMNIHYHHSISNTSNEDRYHIIVARHDATNEWKDLILSAADQAGAVGNFKIIDALP